MASSAAFLSSFVICRPFDRHAFSHRLRLRESPQFLLPKQEFVIPSVARGLLFPLLCVLPAPPSVPSVKKNRPRTFSTFSLLAEFFFSLFLFPISFTDTPHPPS